MTYYEIFQRFLEVFIQLHPPPPSSLQPIPSSLQHPQRYKNQNITRNLGNSPNLGKKRSKSCPFCLKIGAHGILEVLIPNPDLEFWNSKPKSIFSQIWEEKVKVVTQSISRMLLLIPALIFWISNSKSIFGYS